MKATTSNPQIGPSFDFPESRYLAAERVPTFRFGNTGAGLEPPSADLLALVFYSGPSHCVAERQCNV